MTYTTRRKKRHQRMRRCAAKQRVIDVITLIKDFIPELIAALGISFAIFYVIPIMLTALSVIVRR